MGQEPPGTQGHAYSNRCSAYAWVEADWKQVERDFGLIKGMEGVPNALKIASATYEPSATVISFCNPALLKETVDKLANKDYVCVAMELFALQTVIGFSWPLVH